MRSLIEELADRRHAAALGRVYLKLRTAEHEYGKCRASRSPGEARAGHRPALEPGPGRRCLPQLRAGGGGGVPEAGVGAAGVLG